MKILRGTVFGGIAYFLLGWLVWGILLMDFLSGNMNQCANRPDAGMIWWAIILSNFVVALLLTLILNWAGAKSITDGLKYGALFGLLFASAMAFSSWSMTTMYTNMGAMAVDIAASAVVLALVGLVITLTWGRSSK
jgi:hypothetical protein